MNDDEPINLQSIRLTGVGSLSRPDALREVDLLREEMEADDLPDSSDEGCVESASRMRRVAQVCRRVGGPNAQLVALLADALADASLGDGSALNELASAMRELSDEGEE